MQNVVLCACCNGHACIPCYGVCPLCDGKGHMNWPSIYENYILRKAAEWAKLWKALRESFQICPSTPLFVQLRKEPFGLSKCAASFLKHDLDPVKAEEVFVQGLSQQRWFDKCKPGCVGEVFFFEKDWEHHPGHALLQVWDVFNVKNRTLSEVSHNRRYELVDQLRIWLSDLQSEPLSTITTMVSEHWQNKAKARGNHLQALTDAVAELIDTMSEALGTSVDLNPFGSSTFGVFDAGSDIDCLVSIGHGDTIETYSAWTRCLDVMQLQPNGWTVVASSCRAHTPVITLHHAGRWPTVSVDLAFGERAEIGMETSYFFGKLIRSDERVAPVLSFIKQRLRELQVLGAPAGYFSSFAYLSMMLSVLVEIGVVPDLRQSFNSLPARWVGGCNVAHREVPEDWRSKTEASLGQLVILILDTMTTPGKKFALTDPDELHRYGSQMCQLDAMPPAGQLHGRTSQNERAIVVISFVPFMRREREVLLALARHYQAALVHGDVARAEAKDEHSNAVALEVQRAVFRDKKRLVVVMDQLSTRGLPTLQRSLPEACIAILVPRLANLYRNSPGFSKLPIPLQSVRWSLFQALAHPAEAQYRRQFPSIRRSTFIRPDEDLPVVGQEQLTAEQHQHLSTIFQGLGVSLQKSLDASKFQGEHVRILLLHCFYAQIDTLPHELEHCSELLSQGKPNKKVDGPRLGQALRDMMQGTGAFQQLPILPSSDSALEEIIARLDELLCQIS